MRVLYLSIFFFITGLVFTSERAEAHNWQSYAASQNEDIMYYYDTESLKYISKYRVEVWGKAVYVTPQRKQEVESEKTVEYSLSLYRINCISRKYNLNLIAHYGTKGELISFYDTNSPDWIPSVPESNIEILYDTLCPQK